MSNDKAREAFVKTLNDTSAEENPSISVQKAMKAMNIEIIKGMTSMEFRVSCILGLIYKSNISDSEVDFKMINELLTSDIKEYSYNIIPEIKTIKDLEELRDTITNATICDLAYRKCICKDCGDVFYLTAGEVQFYEDRHLKMPTHCKYCKKGIEKPKKIVKKEVVEERIPTAMELALKKAGL